MARLPAARETVRPVPNPVRPLPQGQGALPALRTGAAAAEAGADLTQRTPSILQDSAEALGNAADRIMVAEAKIQSRQDVISRERAITAFQTAAEEELVRLQTEGDFSKVETGKKYADYLRQQRTSLVGNLGGSPDSQALLAAQLERSYRGYMSQASQIGRAAQTKALDDAFGSSLNSLTAGVRKNPGTLVEAFKSLDDRIAEMAGGLTPEQEMSYADVGREQLAMSALDSLLDIGAYEEAKDVLAETPGLMRHLSPQAQEQIAGRITQFERAEQEAAMAGRRKREELAAYLGHEPTQKELYDYVGIETGSGGPEYQSTVGKLLGDRMKAVKQYGADSEQVKALDAVIKSETTGEKPKFSDVSGLQGRFVQQSRNFVDVRDAYSKIKAAAEQDSGAGDIAMIYGFVRLQSPGIVSDREADLVASTGGAGEMVRLAWQRTKSGNRLTEEMRQGLVNASEAVFTSQINGQVSLEDQYAEIATRNSMDPKDVVIDYIQEYRPASNQQPDQSGSAMQNQGTSSEPVYNYDLQGNPAGAAPAPSVSGTTVPIPHNQGSALRPDEQAASTVEDPRVASLQFMLSMANKDELKSLTEKDQGIVAQLAGQELAERGPEEAQDFIARFDETMINKDTNPGMIKRIQEALVDLGYEVKVNGRYSAALLKKFKEAKSGS